VKTAIGAVALAVLVAGCATASPPRPLRDAPSLPPAASHLAAGYDQGAALFYAAACVANPAYTPGGQDLQCDSYRALSQVNTWPGVRTWVGWCADTTRNNGLIPASELVAAVTGCLAAWGYAVLHPHGGKGQT
jgi:hypothetical protein